MEGLVAVWPELGGLRFLHVHANDKVCCMTCRFSCRCLLVCASKWVSFYVSSASCLFVQFVQKTLRFRPTPRVHAHKHKLKRFIPRGTSRRRASRTSVNDAFIDISIHHSSIITITRRHKFVLLSISLNVASRSLQLQVYFTLSRGPEPVP